MIASLKGFLKELPLIGFNSGRYDLNLIKKIYRLQRGRRSFLQQLISAPEDIYKLIASLKGFLKELPVIGFNSGRCDLNLIKILSYYNAVGVLFYNN